MQNITLSWLTGYLDVNFTVQAEDGTLGSSMYCIRIIQPAPRNSTSFSLLMQLPGGYAKMLTDESPVASRSLLLPWTAAYGQATFLFSLPFGNWIVPLSSGLQLGARGTWANYSFNSWAENAVYSLPYTVSLFVQKSPLFNWTVVVTLPTNQSSYVLTDQSPTQALSVNLPSSTVGRSVGLLFSFPPGATWLPGGSLNTSVTLHAGPLSTMYSFTVVAELGAPSTLINLAFTLPSNDAKLTALSFAIGTLVPPFSSSTYSYVLSIPAGGLVGLTATATASSAQKIEVGVNYASFMLAPSGATSSSFTVTVGSSGSSGHCR
jgi:hypothetical protein